MRKVFSSILPEFRPPADIWILRDADFFELCWNCGKERSAA
jgi:hypothetical protein